MYNGVFIFNEEMRNDVKVGFLEVNTAVNRFLLQLVPLSAHIPYAHLSARKDIYLSTKHFLFA
jgi:hypothetical protein